MSVDNSNLGITKDTGFLRRTSDNSSSPTSIRIVGEILSKKEPPKLNGNGQLKEEHQLKNDALPLASGPAVKLGPLVLKTIGANEEDEKLEREFFTDPKNWERDAEAKFNEEARIETSASFKEEARVEQEKHSFQEALKQLQEALKQFIVKKDQPLPEHLASSLSRMISSGQNLEIDAKKFFSILVHSISKTGIDEKDAVKLLSQCIDKMNVEFLNPDYLDLIKKECDSKISSKVDETMMSFISKFQVDLIQILRKGEDLSTIATFVEKMAFAAKLLNIDSSILVDHLIKTITDEIALQGKSLTLNATVLVGKLVHKFEEKNDPYIESISILVNNKIENLLKEFQNDNLSLFLKIGQNLGSKAKDGGELQLGGLENKAKISLFNKEILRGKSLGLSASKLVKMLVDKIQEGLNHVKYSHNIEPNGTQAGIILNKILQGVSELPNSESDKDYIRRILICNIGRKTNAYKGWKNEIKNYFSTTGFLKSMKDPMEIREILKQEGAWEICQKNIMIQTKLDIEGIIKNNTFSRDTLSKEVFFEISVESFLEHLALKIGNASQSTLLAMIDERIEAFNKVAAEVEIRPADKHKQIIKREMERNLQELIDLSIKTQNVPYSNTLGMLSSKSYYMKQTNLIKNIGETILLYELNNVNSFLNKFEVDQAFNYLRNLRKTVASIEEYYELAQQTFKGITETEKMIKYKEDHHLQTKEGYIKMYSDLLHSIREKRCFIENQLLILSQRVLENQLNELNSKPELNKKEQELHDFISPIAVSCSERLKKMEIINNLLNKINSQFEKLEKILSIDLKKKDLKPNEEAVLRNEVADIRKEITNDKMEFERLCNELKNGSMFEMTSELVENVKTIDSNLSEKVEELTELTSITQKFQIGGIVKDGMLKESEESLKILEGSRKLLEKNKNGILTKLKEKQDELQQRENDLQLLSVVSPKEQFHEMVNEIQKLKKSIIELKNQIKEENNKIKEISHEISKVNYRIDIMNKIPSKEGMDQITSKMEEIGNEIKELRRLKQLPEKSKLEEARIMDKLLSNQVVKDEQVDGNILNKITSEEISGYTQFSLNATRKTLVSFMNHLNDITENRRTLRNEQSQSNDQKFIEETRGRELLLHDEARLIRLHVIPNMKFILGELQVQDLSIPVPSSRIQELIDSNDINSIISYIKNAVENDNMKDFNKLLVYTTKDSDSLFSVQVREAITEYVKNSCKEAKIMKKLVSYIINVDEIRNVRSTEGLKTLYDIANIIVKCINKGVFKAIESYVEEEYIQIEWAFRKNDLWDEWLGKIYSLVEYKELRELINEWKQPRGRMVVSEADEKEQSEFSDEYFAKSVMEFTTSLLKIQGIDVVDGKGNKKKKNIGVLQEPMFVAKLKTY